MSRARAGAPQGDQHSSACQKNPRGLRGRVGGVTWQWAWFIWLSLVGWIELVGLYNSGGSRTDKDEEMAISFWGGSGLAPLGTAFPRVCQESLLRWKLLFLKTVEGKAPNVKIKGQSLGVCRREVLSWRSDLCVPATCTGFTGTELQRNCVGWEVGLQHESILFGWYWWGWNASGFYF